MFNSSITVYSQPFFHVVIDNFLDPVLAETISNEFFAYDDPRWFHYNNPIEKKKTINHWNYFPTSSYRELSRLCSNEFIHTIQKITGIEKLYPDIGLHGGGWHLHGRDDKLNVHKDYSIHPKLNLLRKLNLILYLTKDWQPSWGGALEFWSHDQEHNKPKEKVTEVQCLFNRAVLFDTTQNSWHGLPTPLSCPEDVYRKSLAVYYLTDSHDYDDPRQRALFVPTKDQMTNPEIMDLCEKRSKF